MSRKSSASFNVVPIGLPTRLLPPDDLNASQAALWEVLVSSKPVEWFGEDSGPLLKEYVRAVSMSDVLETHVQKALDAGDDKDMGKLLVLRDRESKRVASLATKLRLTQQSRYTPRAAATANKKASAGGKPWQFGK